MEAPRGIISVFVENKKNYYQNLPLIWSYANGHIHEANGQSIHLCSVVRVRTFAVHILDSSNYVPSHRFRVNHDDPNQFA